MQGRLGEALAAYDVACRDHPDAWCRGPAGADVLRRRAASTSPSPRTTPSSSITPTNVVAKAGRAEVLRTAGRLDESLAAYEGALPRAPGEHRGQARPRRGPAQHGPPGAPRSRRATPRLRDHPGDKGVKLARAGLLKAGGRPGEALRAYESLVQDHPGCAAAHTGRDEALKAQGRRGDALRAYQAILRDHPLNVVARNGCAEVLKSPGALRGRPRGLRRDPPRPPGQRGGQERLRRHAQGAGSPRRRARRLRRRPPRAPRNTVLGAGRADILRSLGRSRTRSPPTRPSSATARRSSWPAPAAPRCCARWGASRTRSPSTRPSSEQHPTNVAAKTGRARVFRASGRLDDARRAYEAAGREHPGDRSIKRGSAPTCSGRRAGSTTRAPPTTPCSAPTPRTSAPRSAAPAPTRPSASPRTRCGPCRAAARRASWSGWASHARGLILLRAGKVDEALRVSRTPALRPVPPPPRRLPHRDGRRPPPPASPRRGRRRPRRGGAAPLRPQAELLRVHAFGARAALDEARCAYRLLPPAPAGLVRELVGELGRRFVDRSSAQHDDAWLYRQEIDACLLSA